jgi:outer membrane protein assembly factor BamB
MMPRLRAILVLLLTCAAAPAADWPQWLGPDRDASSPEKVAPWKGNLPVLWHKPVGEGHSSPVVAGGRVYLHTRVKGRDEEALTAYDAATGEQLWQTAYARAPYKGLFGSGPRATPAVVGGRVYTFGITGLLTCFDAGSGKRLWQVDTLKEFHASNLFFGASCSPLVAGDLVLVNVGGKGASVVAFHKDSGKVAWKALDDRASYSSPIAFGQAPGRGAIAQGLPQVVFLTARGLVSLSPSDGSVFWRFPLEDRLSESSTTPVRAGDILVGSSITVGSVGLRLGGKEGKPSAALAWRNEALTCYFSTPVAVGKRHLYLVTGTKPPAVFIESTLRCLETASGKELWQHRGVGKYHASLLRTGDDRLLMLEEAGNLVLLEPSPKEYRELARAKICGNTWAHPALAEGRLFVRDDKELIGVRLAK